MQKTPPIHAIAARLYPPELTRARACRLAPEILLLFAYLFLENVRLFLSSKGNKTEDRLLLGLSMLLMLPSGLSNIYYIIFQIYVLRIDEIFNIISLIFLAFELIFCTYAILRFG